MQKFKNLKWFFNTVSTLVLIWWLLSGKFDALHFGIGVLGAVLISANFYSKRSSIDFPLFRFLAFVPWHLLQVIISNLRVARLALLPGKNFEASFLHLPPGITNRHGLALLGFGVTLTPGTLTVDIDSDFMLIHALDRASAEDIEQETMSQRVRQVFKED